MGCSNRSNSEAFLWTLCAREHCGFQLRIDCFGFRCANSQLLNVFYLANSVVYAGAFDATVKLWDLKSQQSRPIQTLDEAKDSVTCMLIASDTYIMTGSVDGHVRTYDLRAGQLTSDFFEGESLASDSKD